MRTSSNRLGPTPHACDVLNRPPPVSVSVCPTREVSRVSRRSALARSTGRTIHPAPFRALLDCPLVRSLVLLASCLKWNASSVASGVGWPTARRARRAAAEWRTIKRRPRIAPPPPPAAPRPPPPRPLCPLPRRLVRTKPRVALLCRQHLERL